jgi:hypothetical protein
MPHGKYTIFIDRVHTIRHSFWKVFGHFPVLSYTQAVFKDRFVAVPSALEAWEYLSVATHIDGLAEVNLSTMTLGNSDNLILMSVPA